MGILVYNFVRWNMSLRLMIGVAPEANCRLLACGPDPVVTAEHNWCLGSHPYSPQERPSGLLPRP